MGGRGRGEGGRGRVQLWVMGGCGVKGRRSTGREEDRTTLGAQGRGGLERGKGRGREEGRRVGK